MDYLELNITITPREPWAEIIVAQLAEYGFDSFVDSDEGVLAYGPQKDVDLTKVLEETFLNNELEDVKFSFTHKIIPHQNWNAQWESDFQPVEVEDYLTILAPFHDKNNRKGMIVEIQPQMSFGTGHHETTWLMSKSMFELKSIPSNVLDMGTGTGVLAIIAEKMGAESILAIDIEDWSVENTIENSQRNNCTKIKALCTDKLKVQCEKFGLILANINKNVLKAQIESYSQALEVGGTLLLSGFFVSDVDELTDFCAKFALKQSNLRTKDSWACIELIKE
jgi:ribosomal protein L11 methyltransferase